MKNFYPVLYALLFGALIMTLSVLGLMPYGDDALTPMGAVGGRNSESNDDGVALGSREIANPTLGDIFPAVITLGGPADAIAPDAVASTAETQPRVHAAGIGGLRREELMVEANRIMSDLHRDGVFTKPNSYACAFADTSWDPVATISIRELYLGMHRKHLALVERALAFGGRDSLTVREWSEIRMGLARLRNMAAALRIESAPAAR